MDVWEIWLGAKWPDTFSPVMCCYTVHVVAVIFLVFYHHAGMVGYLVSLDSSEQLSSETQSISNNKARVNVAMYENIHNLFRKGTGYL